MPFYSSHLLVILLLVGLVYGLFNGPLSMFLHQFACFTRYCKIFSNSPRLKITYILYDVNSPSYVKPSVLLH